MNETGISKCPKCESELIVEWITERHKINVGVGFGGMTVAQDEWRHIPEMTCDHNPSTFTDDEYNEIFENAEVNNKYDGI